MAPCGTCLPGDDRFLPQPTRRLANPRCCPIPGDREAARQASGLTVVAYVTSAGLRERRLDTRPSTECAFYISSLPADAPRLLQAIRDHWSLDVIFGEDASHVRIGHALHNFALLRRLAPSRIPPKPPLTRNASGPPWRTISSCISCLSFDAITLGFALLNNSSCQDFSL
jgi:hypothetical protein